MERLSAGICDHCFHCGIMYDGNGIDEPFISIPFCPKTNNEIIPAPDSHKGMRVNDCEYYQEDSLPPPPNSQRLAVVFLY